VSENWWDDKESVLVNFLNFEIFIKSLENLGDDEVKMLAEIHELLAKFTLQKLMKCTLCADGSAMPSYGVAPHRHNMKLTGSVIGSTEVLPQDNWPDNFEPDLEPSEVWDGKGLMTGTYYCENLECDYSKQKFKDRLKKDNLKLKPYLENGSLSDG